MQNQPASDFPRESNHGLQGQVVGHGHRGRAQTRKRECANAVSPRCVAERARVDVSKARSVFNHTARRSQNRCSPETGGHQFGRSRLATVAEEPNEEGFGKAAACQPAHTRRHQRLATTRARVSRSLGRRKTPRADHQHRDRLTPHGRAEARDPWLQIARRGRAVLDCFPPWRSGARETSAGS